MLEKKVEAKARPMLDANTWMFSLMVIGSLKSWWESAKYFASFKSLLYDL